MATNDTISILMPGEAGYGAGAYWDGGFPPGWAAFRHTDDYPYAEFTGFCNRQYSGNGLYLTLIWSPYGALGNVKWLASFERLYNGLLLSASSYGVELASSLINLSSFSSGRAFYTDIPFSNTQIDGLSAGELYHVKVRRDNTVVSNLAGTLRLHAVIVREQ